MSVTFSPPQADDGVGTLVLDRPPANSYDRDVVEALDEALQRAAADESTRVIVVRSALERFFCAGADVKAFAGSDPDTNMAMVRRAHQVLNSIADMPELVIAEINGHALGGGLEIALACDVRFAADGGYRIGLPESTLGLLPGTGGTQRLPRLIGPGKALEMMAAGLTLSPQEAADLGIVERVVPAEELRDTTAAFARAVAGGAPLAVANIKQAVHRGMSLPLTEALELELDLIDPLFRSADAREGMGAFIEKRAARFTGR